MQQFQYYLNKLAEESAEVAQIALKSAQFGPEELMPGQPLTNFQRCHAEINDFMAIIEELNDKFNFGYVIDRNQIDAKKVKVKKYLDLSIYLGLVQKD
jgi:hypothetical protein